MNRTERQMAEILRVGREKYGVLSVKAEFEAEGTRVDELLRLVDVARSVGVKLTVKIGGCEAIRDLLEVKQLGVQYVVAPMVETPYALSKYVEAKNLVFDAEERGDVDFLCNMETFTGFDNREAVVQAAAVEGGIQGLVFGRVDFVGSLQRHRDDINKPDITDRIIEVGTLCKAKGLDLVVGGGVSIDSIAELQRIRSNHLTRFETRKVVFDGAAIELADIRKGLLNAVHFELLWLINKREYYGRITREDAKRIEMLESRWRVLGSEIDG